MLRTTTILNANLIPPILATPDQCRKPATEPRLSSEVVVHLATSTSAQANREKAPISVEPWILPWYPACIKHVENAGSNLTA